MGTAEGNLRSLEDESARLRLQNQQLGRDRAEIDTEASDSRAKLQALAEKVRSLLWHLHVTATSGFGIFSEMRAAGPNISLRIWACHG